MEILKFYDGGRPYVIEDFIRLQNVIFETISKLAGSEAANERSFILSGFKWSAGTVGTGYAWIKGKLYLHESTASISDQQEVFITPTTSEETAFKTHQTGGSKATREIRKCTIETAQPIGDYIRFWANDEINGPRFITGDMITTETIGGDHIKVDAITAKHIGNQVIGSGAIADDAIRSKHFYPGAVDTEALGASSVSRDKLVDFGLADKTWRPLTMGGGVTGTATYMRDSSGFVVLKTAQHLSFVFDGGQPVYVGRLPSPDLGVSDTWYQTVLAWIKPNVLPIPAYVYVTSNGYIYLYINADAGDNGKTIEFHLSGVRFRPKTDA